MVRAAPRLFDGEVRHEPVRARPRGRIAAQGIAVNALWPRTTIATSAIRNLLGGDAIVRASRTPEILADAAYAIFQKPARSFTGHFLIDDTFLAEEGVTDFEQYRVDPSCRSRRTSSCRTTSRRLDRPRHRAIRSRKSG